MKRKVNLRLVEGNENLVTKNEILYKKDSTGKISLMKRNNKGILESITGGGSSEGDNVAYLYPKDKSKAVTEEYVDSFLHTILECKDTVLGALYDPNNYFGRLSVLYTDDTKDTLNNLWSMAEKMFPKTEDGTVATYIHGFTEDSPYYKILAGFHLSYEGAEVYNVLALGSEESNIYLAISLAKAEDSTIDLVVQNLGQTANTNVFSENHPAYILLNKLIGSAPEKVTTTKTNTISSTISDFEQNFFPYFNCAGTIIKGENNTPAGGWGCEITPTTSNTSIANGFTANFYYIIGNLPGTKFYKGTMTGAVDSSDSTKYSITITITPLA